MRRRSTRVCVLGWLGWIAALGCASGPLIEIATGADREFAPSDRFAPAHTGVLAIENPDLLDIDLEELHRHIGSAIGWRGLRTASEEEADWLISCAFRKRIIWRSDLGDTETFVEPWDPQGRRVRVVGSSGREIQTRGSMDPAGAQAPEPWVQTLVELRLRSRRTGTVGWSAERRWGRNRQELPEDELRETLQLLLAELRVRGEGAATSRPGPR
jgi:hypothetical protein